MSAARAAVLQSTVDSVNRRRCEVQSSQRSIHRPTLLLFFLRIRLGLIRPTDRNLSSCTPGGCRPTDRVRRLPTRVGSNRPTDPVFRYRWSDDVSIILFGARKKLKIMSCFSKISYFLTLKFPLFSSRLLIFSIFVSVLSVFATYK